MKAKHWFEKIRTAHDQCTPLHLSAGDAASVWKCLRELEIDTQEQANLRAAAGGALRRSNFDGTPKD